MRTSTVLVGLLGGALFTAALVPPLFVALPGRFVDDWYTAGSQAALAGLCLALVAVTLTGFFAASFAPDDAVRTGTIAGLLSVLVGGMLIALPASAIEACASVLSGNPALRPGGSAATAERLRELAAEAVLDGFWLPAAVGLALLATGPALGAMGGVTFDLWRGTVSRTTRTIRLSWVPQLGLWTTCLAVFGASVWAAHLDKTVLVLLDQPASWSDRNALTAPLAVAGAFAGVLLTWAIRDAVLLLRDHRRLVGVMWGTMALSAPVSTFAVAAAVHTAGLLALPPWLFVAAGVSGALAGAWDGASSDLTFEPQPRSAGELIGASLLTGLVVAGALVFVCGASVIGTYTIGFPFVLAVLENASSISFPAGELVSRVFLLHWLAGLLVLLIGGAHLGVAVPLWTVGRIARG